MCGRVIQALDSSEIDALVADTAADGEDQGDRGERVRAALGNNEPNWNAGPGQHLIVVHIEDDEGTTIHRSIWGFIPRWETDPAGGRKPINAKIETIRDNLQLGRGLWRDAARMRRAIFPANSFYEWDRSRKPSVPYSIRKADGSTMALAALWDKRRDRATGLELRSFAVITCPANSLIATIHDRMPVILDPENYRLWLSGPVEAALSLCVPYPAEHLTMHRVGQRVGNVRNNDPGMADPIGP